MGEKKLKGQELPWACTEVQQRDGTRAKCFNLTTRSVLALGVVSSQSSRRNPVLQVEECLVCSQVLYC